MRHTQSIRWPVLFAAVGLIYGCNVYTEELLAGSEATGGEETGGTPSTGGTSTGGARSGGAPSGGAPSGGAPSGGDAGGSARTGGAPSGGTSSGGTGGTTSSTGGAAIGGSDDTGGAPVAGGAGGVVTGGAATSGGQDVGGTSGAAPNPTGGAPATGGASNGGDATGGAVTAPGYTVIDLVDTANNSIELADGEGYWYTIDDGGGTISPDTSGSEKLVATDLPEERDGSLLGIHVVADDGFDTWGSGLGFDLNSPSSSTKNKYDVSRYTNLVFWARAGTGSFDMRVNVLTAEIVADTNPGGECTTKCDDAYGVDISLDETWREYTIGLTAPPLAQVGWGADPGFDPSSVLSIQFQAGVGVAFDIWIDDVQFYTE